MQWLVLLPLLAIIYEDFRYRAIHWIWVLVLAILGFVEAPFSFKKLIINLVFLTVQYLGITLYFSLKNKRWTNVTEGYIGLGDILFFISIVGFYNIRELVHFFILGLLFSLIGFLGFQKIKYFKSATIPLAGWLSVFMIICSIIKQVCHVNLLTQLRLI